MKRILTWLLCLTALSAAASIVVLFDLPNGQVRQIISSANTLEYLSRSNALINPSIPTNDLRSMYVTNGAIALWSSQQLLDREMADSNLLFQAVTSNAALVRSNNIFAAKNIVRGTTAPDRLIRWQTLLMLDQLNELRKLHSLSVITTNQLINALSNAVVNDSL